MDHGKQKAGQRGIFWRCDFGGTWGDAEFWDVHKDKIPPVLMAMST